MQLEVLVEEESAEVALHILLPKLVPPGVFYEIRLFQGKPDLLGKLEELEAWFFGDVPALVQAYPGVPSTLANQAKYRDPDQIAGGTAEALHNVLRAAGYYKRTHLPKVEVARTISSHMNPAANRSRSFCCFRDGVAALTT